MKQPFPSQAVKWQQGATLIVMVIATTLMLLAVLFVSINMTMGTRRTTNTQRQTIPAQFAAETGMAVAKATLESSNLITSGGSTVKPDDVKIKDATGTLVPNVNYKSPLEVAGISKSFNTVMNELTTLCGGTVQNLRDVTPPTTDLVYNGTTFSGYTEVCKFNTDSLPYDRLKVISDLFVPERTDVKTVFAGKGLELTEEDKRRFFEIIFNNAVTNTLDANTSYTVKGGFQPIALIRQPASADATASTSVTDYPYFLVFQVADFNSKGTSREANRYMKMNNTSPVYALKLNMQFFGASQQVDPDKSFNEFGYFVNDFASVYWDSNDAMLNGGRMHTNTAFNIRAGYTLDGKISSAGCGGLINGEKDPVTGLAKRICAPTQVDTKNYIVNPYTNTQVRQSDFKNLGSIPTSQPMPAPGSIYYGNDPSDFYLRYNPNRTGNGVDVNADFIELPTNAKNQQQLAQMAGFAINQQIDRILLRVVNEGGVKYQYFDFLIQKNGKSELHQFRHSAPDPVTKKVEMQMRSCIQTSLTVKNDCDSTMAWQNAKKGTGTFGWEPDANPGPDEFNGVVYTSNVINSLTGPLRDPAGLTKPTTFPAAIADFANITITTNGQVGSPGKSIGITGDLALENPTVGGVLGLYTVNGYIYVPDTGRYVQNTDPYFSSMNAPNNVRVDAFMMSSGGSFRVINPTATRGNIQLYGGFVGDQFSQTRDAYGNGYGFNISYDNRGYAPLGYPTYRGNGTTTNIVPSNTRLVGVEMGYVQPLATANIAVPQIKAGEVRQVAAPKVTTP